MQESMETDRIGTVPAPEDWEIPPDEARTDLPMLAIPNTAIVTPVPQEPVTEPIPETPARPPRREPRREPHPSAGVSDVGDRIFAGLTAGFAGLILAALAAILIVLAVQARDSITSFGLRFLTGSTWDPIGDVFGAKPAILG